MPQKRFIHDKKTDRKYCISGCKASKREAEDETLRKDFSNHIKVSAEELPPKVDLRPLMTTVEDQNPMNCCVGNAFAGAYEYLLKKQNDGRSIDVSRLFIYYNARLIEEEKEKEKLTNIDDGCSIVSGLEALKQYGVCDETFWKYEKGIVNKRPDTKAYEAAKSRKIYDTLKLKIDLTEMKQCLAQGLPFVFGLEVFKSFHSHHGKGVISMPTPKEVKEETPGGFDF
ncbi:unnamed protein product [Rotaria sp. Silwood1]|nr:unnamed protein product [Rotaria sp. Silwood1]